MRAASRRRLLACLAAAGSRAPACTAQRRPGALPLVLNMVPILALTLALTLALAACGDAPPGTEPRAPAVEEGTPEDGGGAGGQGPGALHIRELATRAERYTGALGHFLNTGPTDGTWSVQKPNHLRTWEFAPHPTETESLLMADLDEAGTRRGIQVVHRGAVPRLFFEAQAWLFFANYALDGEPVLAPLEGTTAAVLLTWRPVHDGGGLTGRRAWFDRESGDILKIEDRSRTGHVMRTVRRHPVPTSRLDVPSGDQAGCCGRPLANVAADDIRRALRAPFAIYEPAALPHGFVRIRADYRAAPIEEDREAAPVHFSTLLYSDGLALLSLVIAPRPDMNAIVAHYGRMPTRDGDPDACPGLPTETGEVRDTRAAIRMRSDICQTILRRDDVAEDLSVMLMGRNELPLDSYVQVISGLRRVTGP